MPLYKFQISVAADSLLPRDRLVNTVHLDDRGALSDPEGLANDIADMWLATWLGATGARELQVSAYNVGPPPQFPVATVIRNPGTFADSTCPREVALCLSYYAERNLPRQRGRIYLPVGLIGQAPSRRPSEFQLERAMTVARGLVGIGGVDVDWVVRSDRDNAHRKVTHAWVDDEWDTQRRRGLRATTRQEEAVGA